MEIHPKSKYRELALSVIMGGVRDYLEPRRVNGDLLKNPYNRAKKQLEAFEFLVSKDFQFWADMADRDLDADEIIRNASRARCYLLASNRRKR